MLQKLPEYAQIDTIMGVAYTAYKKRGKGSVKSGGGVTIADGKYTKHNSFVDAKTGKYSLVALKLASTLYYTWLRERKSQFTIKLSNIREVLDLKNSQSYVEQIQKALLGLKQPIELVNYNDPDGGGEVKWAVTSFLDDARIYKKAQSFVLIKVNEGFLKLIEQERGGISILDINLQHRFRSVYSFKLYELFMRENNKLKRGVPKKLGVATQTIEELCVRFGCNLKHPSKWSERLAPAIEELTEKGIKSKLEYDKNHKIFKFFWNKDDEYPDCRIPLGRVDEFTQWVFDHQYSTTESRLKIEDAQKLKNSIKTLIRTNKLEGLDLLYRAMLKHKYHLEPSNFYSERDNMYIEHDGTFAIAKKSQLTLDM